MSVKPDITVIIPTFNNFDLSAALKSLVDQTYKNFKVIIINDGGRDVQNEINNFPELKTNYISYEKNKGLPTRLNEAIELVDTTFIARLDADDYCLPERLEYQRAYIIENKLDLIGCSTVICNKKTGFKIKETVFGTEEVKSEALICSPLSHPTYFGKSGVFKSIRYDERFRYSQDYDFICRTLLAGFQVSNCPSPLLIYKVHNDTKLEKVFFQIEAANSISKAYRGSLFKNSDYSPLPPQKKYTWIEKALLGLRQVAFSREIKLNGFFLKLGYFLLSCIASSTQRSFFFRNFAMLKKLSVTISRR